MIKKILLYFGIMTIISSLLTLELPKTATETMFVGGSFVVIAVVVYTFVFDIGEW